MGTDKFNWKNLFINEDKSEENSKDNVKSGVKSSKTFPDSIENNPSTGFSFHNTSQISSLNQKTLEAVLEMYERGFDSLNRPGYDFYEFFKSIMAINPDKSETYVMAYTMAQSMDKNLSKDKLLLDADFYISEIEKVHSDYELQGNNKKAEIITIQKNEKDNLIKEIAVLQDKLKSIQRDLETRTTLLDRVDSKYASKVIEIEDKLTANNIANETILKAISKIVDGIKNHIK